MTEPSVSLDQAWDAIEQAERKWWPGMAEKRPIANALLNIVKELGEAAEIVSEWGGDGTHVRPKTVMDLVEELGDTLSGITITCMRLGISRETLARVIIRKMEKVAIDMAARAPDGESLREQSDDVTDTSIISAMRDGHSTLSEVARVTELDELVVGYHLLKLIRGGVVRAGEMIVVKQPTDLEAGLAVTTFELVQGSGVGNKFPSHRFEPDTANETYSQCDEEVNPCSGVRTNEAGRDGMAKRGTQVQHDADNQRGNERS